MIARNATIGDLDSKIEVQKSFDAPGPAGGYERQFEHHAFHWAQVTPVRGDESERQGALRNVNRAIFTVYRDMSVKEDMRILWLGEAFNIQEIRRPPERQQLMDIVADQGITQ